MYAYIILFFLGIAVGSFMNVATMRYRPEGRFFDIATVQGRSRCPQCAKQLQWFELIPLASFIMQRGKCRSCGARLSFQYPIVEAITGVMFFAVPLSLNSFYAKSVIAFAQMALPAWYYALIFLWLLVFLTLLAITIIDLKYFIIPNELNLALGVLGVVIAGIIGVYSDALPLLRDSFLEHYALLFTPFKGVLMNRLFGALGGGLVFGLLSFASGGKAMGFGDVKLAFAAGLLFGWPDIALVMSLSFILGGLWGGALLLLKTKTLKDKLPFAPFFIAGSVLTFFVGFPIIEGYFKLMG